MLRVHKSGAIQGGEVNWQYDEEKQAVHYWGNVKLKIGPFKKTVKFDEDYPVERAKLESKNVQAGQTIDLEGGGKLNVKSVSDGMAYCTVDGDNYSGIVDFDVTQDLVDPVHVDVKVNYNGLKATIKADRE
jgi:hypothetical protein